MKIIDTTTFFEENMMMDIRFNILNSYVDKFIVCESLYTHSGKKKEINFNINDYPKFKNKIMHLILENEHEIAFHTMKHTRIDSLDMKEKFDDEIKMFNKLTNGKSKGFRAPSFSLNNHSSWAIEILEKNHYVYLQQPEQSYYWVPAIYYYNRLQLDKHLLCYEIVQEYLQHLEQPYHGHMHVRYGERILIFTNLLRSIF